jgi:hypothetical protein
VAKVVDVINLSNADMASFGGSAVTVPAFSRVDAITVTDAGLGTAVDTLLCAVVKSTASEVQKRYAAKMLKRTPPYQTLAPGLKDQGC